MAIAWPGILSRHASGQMSDLRFLGPPVKRLESGYQLFQWSILVGEPSQPKKGKRALLGDLVLIPNRTTGSTVCKPRVITGKPIGTGSKQVALDLSFSDDLQSLFSAGRTYVL